MTRNRVYGERHVSNGFEHGGCFFPADVVFADALNNIFFDMAGGRETR